MMSIIMLTLYYNAKNFANQQVEATASKERNTEPV